MFGYKVIVNYPNGKVEEVEEFFPTLEKAREYGEYLLAQVRQNASLKGGLFGRKPKCRFSVIEKKDSDSSIVYESDR